MIENTFFKILNNDTSITALLDASGIHYQKNEFPDQNKFIVYSVQSHGRPLYIDNGAAQQRASVQVDLYSPTQDEVMALRDAVVAALHAKSSTAYEHNIQHISVDFELSGDESDTDLYRIILTVNLYFV